MQRLQVLQSQQASIFRPSKIQETTDSISPYHALAILAFAPTEKLQLDPEVLQEGGGFT